MSEKRKNHSWGKKVPFLHKSERECQNGCGIIKVTRHEGNRHWVEFWRVGAVEKIKTDKTPVCEKVEVDA